MSKTTDNSDGAWTYVIVNEVFVPEKIVEGIFDLFYTKDEARIKSSGIGLYATRKLVIQISGDIQVNYEAGIFTVSIKLPLI